MNCLVDGWPRASKDGGGLSVADIMSKFAVALKVQGFPKNVVISITFGPFSRRNPVQRLDSDARGPYARRPKHRSGPSQEAYKGRRQV